MSGFADRVTLITGAGSGIGRQLALMLSAEGAAIAALFVGFARAAAIHLVLWAELFIVYLVMALVLAFRPEGLFQRVSARKI